jgi:alpha-galactosidase/6-phospho-beta-glucosidase family protein
MDTSNIDLSFRPKNLPRKSPEEEKYHRKLVEENRKKYIKFLQEKQEKERQEKEKIEQKKEKVKKLQEIWERDVLPFWFKKKREYSYIRKLFVQGIPTNLRGKVWLLCIGNHFSITREYYDIEFKKSM